MTKLTKQHVLNGTTATHKLFEKLGINFVKFFFHEKKIKRNKGN